MIQANELRVGNWYSEFGLPKKATGGFIQRLSHIQSLNKFAIDISGIPLTPEILEKAGFSERINGWLKEYEDGCLFTLNKIGERLEFTSHKPKIKYLHQLQNLYFALTGEELQIDL